MADTLTRRRVRIEGRVQGVGFRPFVVTAGQRRGLVGRVWNAGGAVVVDVAGADANVAAFLTEIARGPANARVDRVAEEEAAADAYASFSVAPSVDDDSPREPAPDRAPCEACLRDIEDKNNRRHGYAFASCVDCGPRFTVSTSLPWDRARTSMDRFSCCAACAAELHDVTSRFFHAQTLCCPACGPRLSTTIEAVVRALREGKIAAIKGVGGYHLCCDATRDDVVQRLRQRKSRPAKPLAVMVGTLAEAAEVGVVGEAEANALSSSARPIVIVEKRNSVPLAASVTGMTVGLMLPSSPLHHLLLRAFGGPLVMTSGNVSEEPIVTEEAEAVRCLSGIADVFLHHDRDIVHGLDDSVVRVIGGVARVWRRGRGFAPSSIAAEEAGEEEAIALGGHQRCVHGFSDHGRVVTGPHIGDLDGPRAVERLRASLAHHERVFGVRAATVVCDAHPDYASSLVAEELGLVVERVHHHHAHFAAVLAEHGHGGPAVGVLCDGSGLGDDGTLWGGELVVGDASAIERVDHVPHVRLPGGEAAARQPWRSAVAWLQVLGIVDDDDLLPDVTRQQKQQARSLIEKKTQAPLTSSLGRAFDAAAALCGLSATTTSHSGEAAMALEERASAMALPPPGDFFAVMHAVVDEKRARLPVPEIAARFHARVAAFLVERAASIARDRRLDVVVLGGGCFMNALLLDACERGLRARGLRVLSPVDVPPNDGGLALGQLTVWRARHGRRGDGARR